MCRRSNIFGYVQVNIGQARLANLEKDLHLKGTQYDIALTVFFVSYILVEVPSNLALRGFKPHRYDCFGIHRYDLVSHTLLRWIFFIMVSWSAVTSTLYRYSWKLKFSWLISIFDRSVLMGIVNNFGGLVATRFMLGLTEGFSIPFFPIVPEPDPVFLGGLFPGINFLLTTWYNRNEQNLVISLLYAGATLAGGHSLFLSPNLLRRILCKKVPLEDFWPSVSDTWPMSGGRMAGPGCARLFP
jgi:MFS transporter, ACS family, DAL5 transporter family protein